mmetsp:Transcript_10252/g.36126  ORF Transcript_10252/g.36126 Transcript_10252/m.36126 type:complete len:279 (-) Transcript_10252:290-1126(-)
MSRNRANWCSVLLTNLCARHKWCSGVRPSKFGRAAASRRWSAPAGEAGGVPADALALSRSAASASSPSTGSSTTSPRSSARSASNSSGCLWCWHSSDKGVSPFEFCSRRAPTPQHSITLRRASGVTPRVQRRQTRCAKVLPSPSINSATASVGSPRAGSASRILVISPEAAACSRRPPLWNFLFAMAYAFCNRAICRHASTSPPMFLSGWYFRTKRLYSLRTSARHVASSKKTGSSARSASSFGRPQNGAARCSSKMPTCRATSSPSSSPASPPRPRQ